MKFIFIAPTNNVCNNSMRVTWEIEMHFTLLHPNIKEIINHWLYNDNKKKHLPKHCMDTEVASITSNIYQILMLEMTSWNIKFINEQRWK